MGCEAPLWIASLFRFQRGCACLFFLLDFWMRSTTWYELSTKKTWLAIILCTTVICLRSNVTQPSVMSRTQPWQRAFLTVLLHQPNIMLQWMNERQMACWLAGWLAGWLGGWMDGRMDGWIDQFGIACGKFKLKDLCIKEFWLRARWED